MPQQQSLHAQLVIFPIQCAQPLLAIHDDDHPAGGSVDTLDKQALNKHGDRSNLDATHMALTRMFFWRFSDAAMTPVGRT
jgi:hypothetical protein